MNIMQVGTSLHYHPVSPADNCMVRRDAQPLHAVVMYANSSDVVSLLIVDHDGHQFRRVGVHVRERFVDGIGSHASVPGRPAPAVLETSTGPMSDPGLIAQNIQPPHVDAVDLMAANESGRDGTQDKGDVAATPAVEAASPAQAANQTAEKSARKKAQ